MEAVGMAAWLLSAESPSIPVEISALAALIGIVWWLVRRADSADTQRDTELAQTRKELSQARRDQADAERRHAEEIATLNRTHQAALDVQSDIRHDLTNKLSAARGGLSLTRMAGEQCTCGGAKAAADFAASLLNREQ